MKPVMIEFFSGSARMADAFERRGYNVFTFDNQFTPEEATSMHYFDDVLTLTKERLLQITRGVYPVAFCDSFAEKCARNTSYANGGGQ